MLKPTEAKFTKTVDKIGTFTFKFPSLVDDLEADAITSKLLAGNETPSILATNIATMMGTLTASIVEKPDSFDLEEIYSYDELEAIFNVFSEQVSEFRGKSEIRPKPGDKDEGTVGGEES